VEDKDIRHMELWISWNSEVNQSSSLEPTCSKLRISQGFGEVRFLPPLCISKDRRHLRNPRYTELQFDIAGCWQGPIRFGPAMTTEH
jgi:hypothetical protein